MYLYVKHPNEAKYHHLVKKTKKNGLKYLKDLKALIEYSNNMQDVYEDIEEHNPSKKYVFIIFDDMIADMISNKKLSPKVTELFIRGGKLSISTVFITESYFALPKDVKLYTFFQYENCKQTIASTNRI